MMEFGYDEKFTQREKVWPTLEEVLAKAEWKEDDITVLVNHLNELDDKTLKKLGVRRPETL